VPYPLDHESSALAKLCYPSSQLDTKKPLFKS
jgi:hypothetical protein